MEKEEKKSLKTCTKPKKAVISSLAVFALLLIVISGLLVWMNTPKMKVIRAVKSTLEENPYLEEPVLGLSYQLETKLGKTNLDFNGRVYADRASGEKMADFKTSVSIFKISGQLYLDKEGLKLSLPLLGNHAFLYDYSQNGDDNILTNGMNQEQVETLNRFLKTFSNSFELQENADGKQVLKELVVSEADKRTCTIDGAEQECAGYELQIPELTDGKKVFLYLFEEKIAAVRVQSGSYETTISFTGGKFRMKQYELLSENADSGWRLTMTGSFVTGEEFETPKENLVDISNIGAGLLP